MINVICLFIWIPYVEEHILMDFPVKSFCNVGIGVLPMSHYYSGISSHE